MDRDDRSGTVDRLLQEGLDLYQSGLVDHAIAVWTEAAHVQPDDPRARDCLRQAGVSVDDSDSPVPMSGTRAELEQLLAQRRYEEALELLFAARRQNPSAPEISRGIQLLKQRLVRRYLHQIGNLDHVPKLAIGEADLDSRKLEEEERELVRLVDGISSFGDIAHESLLGRFETFRILAKLVSEQVITQAAEEREEDEEGAVPAPAATAVTMVAELPDASEVGPTPEEMSGETPVSTPLPQPPGRRIWPLLLGLGLVGVAGLLVYLFVGREEPVVPPEATAGAPASLAVPEPPPPTPVPIAAAAVVPDAPSLAAAEPEPTIEIEPPESPAPPTPRATKPRPPIRAAAARRPDTKPEEPAPEAPEEPTTTPTTTPTPTPTPPPPPTPDPDPNPNPTPPPSPPPPARLDALASVAAESVAGALTRSEVDRALARITPGFRACYAAAAARAQKNAGGTVHVSFIVDETGLAQSPEAGPAPLPGLSDCLRDTLRQLRTQLAPDVGVVRVAAKVTFTPLGP